jgi:hypothetical protein
VVTEMAISPEPDIIIDENGKMQFYPALAL